MALFDSVITYMINDMWEKDHAASQLASRLFWPSTVCIGHL